MRFACLQINYPHLSGLSLLLISKLNTPNHDCVTHVCKVNHVQWFNQFKLLFYVINSYILILHIKD